MKPVHCRAARGALDWTQAQLAEKAGVSTSLIKNFEAGRKVPHPNRLEQIKRALDDAGVEFIEAEAGVTGPGIKMRDGVDPDEREIVEEGEDEGGGTEEITAQTLAEFRAEWPDERLAKLSDMGRDAIAKWVSAHEAAIEAAAQEAAAE